MISHLNHRNSKDPFPWDDPLIPIVLTVVGLMVVVIWLVNNY